MPYITNFYLTEVDSDTPDADARLNLDLQSGWQETGIGDSQNTSSGITFRYRNLQRQ